jgi:hypothetical protein
MGKIRIDTERAVGTLRPCAIVNVDDGRDIIPSTDFDYCGFASSFGWTPEKVQMGDPHCDHGGTDGTVSCRKNCGATASDFISSAEDFLANNNGLEADDPGYFSGGE